MKRVLLRSLLLWALVPTALASTTWYVDGVNGNDNNDCKSPQTACKTIGHAISLASSGDSVKVAAATYPENLTISIGLRLIGASPKTTTIDGGGNGTVVTIPNANANVTLTKLTIQNGRAQYGGGISNAGALTVIESTISGNSTDSQCNRQCSGGGGGIYNGGTLTISNSTLSENSADSQCDSLCTSLGGGIDNGGTLTLINSTLSRNSTATTTCMSLCRLRGGGIYNGGTLTISNSTISDNSVTSRNCRSFCEAAGGGIFDNLTAAFRNSMVAFNGDIGNCGGTVTSDGYNLSSDNSCNFNGPGDLNNTDPRLGPLQYNGGPTQTQALLSGSPGIDAGNPSGCTDGNGKLLKTDQRGKPRPDREDKSGCDMGAYERQKD